MAAKKKAKPKKDSSDDIPAGLAEEIQEAVALEDEPSTAVTKKATKPKKSAKKKSTTSAKKKPTKAAKKTATKKATSIPITHWQEEPQEKNALEADEAVEESEQPEKKEAETPAPKKESKPTSSAKKSVAVTFADEEGEPEPDAVDTEDGERTGEIVEADSAPEGKKTPTKIAVTDVSESDESDSGDVPIGAEVDEQLLETNDDEEDSTEGADGSDTQTVQVEDASEDDHAWHILDEDQVSSADGELEPVEESEQTELVDEPTTAEAELDEVEDSERPDWDEEKWQSASAESDDETEEEHPDWDEEKWRQANLDEEEAERPDWDEEKWGQKSEQTELESAAAEIEPEVEESKPEATQGGADTDETETLDRSKTVGELSTGEEAAEEDVDVDHMSAAQAALIDDDKLKEQRAKAAKKSSVRAPKRALLALAAWWGRAKLRNSAIAAAAVFVLIFITLPSPRYAALNTVGVRAEARLTVLDSETQLPLRDVDVSLGGISAQTNATGLAEFDDVRLGNQKLVINKSAYDTYERNVIISTGTNTLNNVSLEAIGTSFEFKLIDWLTDKPVSGAEVSYSQNSAYANDEGIAKLNTPTLNQPRITVTVTAPNYTTKEVEVDTINASLREVKLVIDRPHLFVSKRDGTYDVYKTKADGTGEELLLKGTGNERDDLRFDVSPSGEKSVLVATRDKNIKNRDGFVLSGLYIIDTETGNTEKIDSSERIDIVGWIGERIIYVKIQAGASGQNPDRHRLTSLDAQTGQLDEIASSNYFNDVLVADKYVFYAPSDAYKQNPKPYLFRSNADGTAVETVFERTVWTVIRTGIDSIAFDSNQVWYEGKISQIFNTELSSRPASTTSRLYTANPAGDRLAWVDIRDGQGNLLIADPTTDEDAKRLARGGLRNPVVWLSNTHLIFRVVTSSETADYVIDVSGGDPIKVTDVTNVSGADRWYYYY